jgi:SAM-dependent methyltransferase
MSKQVAPGWLARCRRWLGWDFDYRRAYRKSDLARDWWSIVGPASREEFEALGCGKLQALVDLGLTPASRILDVGCGTGQLTGALLDYLGPEGLYHGTDIAPEAIACCKQRYRRPNVFFTSNAMTSVPIEGVVFDFIYFGSVFTHLYPDEVRLLLADVLRLLAPDGSIVADVFVGTPGGNRGMVVVERGAFLAMLDELGLHAEVVKDWAWQPGVGRTIYRIRTSRR